MNTMIEMSSSLVNHSTMYYDCSVILPKAAMGEMREGKSNTWLAKDSFSPFRNILTDAN